MKFPDMDQKSFMYLHQHPEMVSLDVRVQVMDLARPDVLDNHRLEIVGAVLDAVRCRKEWTYPELVGQCCPRKAVISSLSWQKRKQGENPTICGPEHAKFGGTGGRRSWPAAKAFALSLSEHRGGSGVDGVTPPTTAMICDHRHLFVPG